jgi:ribonucleoside-diphosphate reductase alpha chain
MRLSDDLVELEIEKLVAIKKVCDTDSEKELWSRLLNACTKGRRTGLGTHGLADAIARLNLAYDSDESIEIIEQIYETIRDTAYLESVYLAQERGAFPAFDWEKEKENLYIKRLPKNLSEKIETFGRRNISILTNAPTGSVSIMSQTSSGLEPVFRNSYVRRRKLSHNEQHLEADYIDDTGDKWLEYKVFHHNVGEYLKAFNTDTLPGFFVQSSDIDWSKRIAVQAAIQRSIDHSISSTINLPKGTDPSTVSQIYMEGWKAGLKGITVYVDGSRSGVLLEKGKERFPHHTAPKRPLELECNIHHATIQGEKWIILVGLMEGKPYEVMGGLSNLIEIPRDKAEGFLVKNPRKTINSIYDLKVGKNGDTVIIKDLVRVFDNPNHSAFTRMISLALRHGANIQFTVEQLQKDRDSDMFSFAKCVARVLKGYIPDGQTATEKICGECQTAGLIYLEGCVTCKNCGYAKCG